MEERELRSKRVRQVEEDSLNMSRPEKRKRKVLSASTVAGRRKRAHQHEKRGGSNACVSEGTPKDRREARGTGKNHNKEGSRGPDSEKKIVGEGQTQSPHHLLEQKLEILTQELERRNKLEEIRAKNEEKRYEEIKFLVKRVEENFGIAQKTLTQSITLGSSLHSRDGVESLIWTSKEGVGFPSLVPKPQGSERRGTYINVVKEFNGAVDRMKNEGVESSDKLQKLTREYVRDAQTFMRTKLDTTLPNCRGVMRVRKAFANHGRELGNIMRELESDFPLLRQGIGGWICRAILANVLENGVSGKKRGTRCTSESKEADFEKRKERKEVIEKDQSDSDCVSTSPGRFSRARSSRTQGRSFTTQ